MRTIVLTSEEEQTLNEGFKHHPKFHVRKRFHTMLLSARGWKVKNIASLYKTRTRTIYTWMDRWEKEGVCGLYIKAGRGLKPTLDQSVEEVVELVKKSPNLRPQFN